jgi:hypothetical protein
MLSRWHLTADWLAPRESECSRTRSKVSPDWPPSYIKATRPVLEIKWTDTLRTAQVHNTFVRFAGIFPLPCITHTN